MNFFGQNNFDSLEIKGDEPLHKDQWNGLLEWIKESPLNIHGINIGIGVKNPQKKLEVAGEIVARSSASDRPPAPAGRP